MENDLVIGCVAENNPKYMTQALRLLQSVRWFGGEVADAPFFICCVEGVSPGFREKFERYGGKIKTVPRFNPKHPQSNKLGFFALEEVKQAGRALLLDCDTLLVQDPSAVCRGKDFHFQAKLADAPTVPLPVFERIFRHSGLSMPPASFACTDGTPTIAYFNSGVLILSQPAIRDLVPRWVDFTNRLIGSPGLLGDHFNYCEQASLSLAIAATATEFGTLTEEMNFPAHIEGISRMGNMDPVVIHYHWMADPRGRVKECGYPLANARIRKFNDRLRLEEGALPRGANDIEEGALRLAVAHSRRPAALTALVQLSRENFGWFTKTPSRTLEYPWIQHEIGPCEGMRVLDIGAGVSPLPLMLASKGASVVTIDNSPQKRQAGEGPENWNEWGFLDYGAIDPAVGSFNSDILSVELPGGSIDCAYSVSVVEHMPSAVRKQLWSRIQGWLKENGKLVLTVDLVPGTDCLWNFSEGRQVEPVEMHGDIDALRNELIQAGFRPVKQEVFRKIPSSRVDCMCIVFGKSNLLPERIKKTLAKPGSLLLNNTALLVLGMHRSGTSATAGCLGRMGIYLGRQLVPETKDNPRGYYEHLEINFLHDELLKTLGSGWDDPRPLPEGWENGPLAAPFRQRLRNILERDFAGAPLWGLKEPRMCRLLPLWMPLLSELGVAVKALHVMRGPGEAAASLAARDGMPEHQAMALWLSHNIQAERDTRGCPRTVVLYEDLLSDWRGEMKHLRDALDLRMPEMGPEEEARIDGFLTPGLRHHKTTSAPRKTDDPLAELAERAYYAFSRWRREGKDPACRMDELAGQAAAHAVSAAAGGVQGEKASSAVMVDKVSVVIIQPEGYPHSEAFRELAETVYYGLGGKQKQKEKEKTRAGDILVNSLAQDGLNIIFGAHLLTPEQLRNLPRKSVIYNLEQVDPHSMWRAIEPALGRFPVWDYSRRNIEAFAAMGHGASVFHVPIGYSPELTRIKPAAQQDIDVLFYGSINERRKKILEALREEGLRVEALFGVYGARRDACIARSKVVLGMHFYDSSIFELVRVSYLLSNGKAVVAECNHDTEMDRDLEGAFIPASYDRLVHECKALVRDSGARKALEEAALRRFSARDEDVYLEAGLAWARCFLEKGRASGGRVPASLTREAPGRINLGSGKDFRPEFLNVDWNDYWKPDLVLDLNEPAPFGKTLPSARFGGIVLRENSFDELMANDLFEHIRELSVLMTTCLKLLKAGGELKLKVPYDLSYGAWQDPTHIRAFNERSWLYYTDWFWYMGWTDARFDLSSMKFNLSDYGQTLKNNKEMPDESILRQPRAVDSMEVVLRKRALTPEELDLVKQKSGGSRRPSTKEGSSTGEKSKKKEQETAWRQGGLNGEPDKAGSDEEPDKAGLNGEEEKAEIRKSACQGVQPLKKDGAERKEDAVSGLVSIVLAVPDSKRLKEFQKCLKLLEKHTPQPYELIFAGGSPESSVARWLEKQAGAGPRFKIAGEIDGKGGFAAACNEGIRASAGQYIVLMDSAVEVTEGWLSGMLECMRDLEGAHSEDSLAGPPLVGPRCSGAEGPQGISLHAAGPEQFSSTGKKALAAYGHCRVPARKLKDFCVLAERCLFEKAGLFDESFATRYWAMEDFALRAAAQGSRFFIAAGALVNMDVDGAGTEVFAQTKAKAKTPQWKAEKKILNEKWGSMDALGPEARKLRALKLAWQAVEWAQKKELGNAVEVFAEAVKHSPLNEVGFVKGLFYRFARMLISEGEFGHALEVLSGMPGAWEQDALKNELHGYCRDGLGEPEEAEKCAALALELHGGAGALNLMGLIRYKKGMPESAASFFRDAMGADGGFGEAYVNLGAVRWAEDKKEEALELFEKAFVLSPDQDGIITNYYSALMEVFSQANNGALERAIQFFDMAVGFYPAKKRLRHILAELYLRCGKNREAMGVLEDMFLHFGVDDEALPVALRIRETLGALEVLPDKNAGGEKNKIKNKTRSPLSICMIVKNEENDIVRALLNLRPLADELVVVDTGSSDRTKDLARALGARVFDFEWTGDFSAARNFSLSKAEGGWVLVMDADEVISPDDRKKLMALLRGPNDTAYLLTTRNYIVSPVVWGWIENDGSYPEEDGTGWIRSDKVRLFPNGRGIRFSNPVHEFVEDSLQQAGIKIANCDVPVHHYGKLRMEKVREKGADYYELGQKKKKLSGADVDEFKAAVELAFQSVELNRFEDALENWREVVRIKPDFIEGHLGVANALYMVGRFEEAKQTIDSAFASPLDCLEALYLYARLLVFLGAPEEAIELLEKSGSKKTHPMTLATMVLARICAGKSEGVAELARDAWRLMDLPSMMAHYAKMMLGHGRLDSAIGLLEGLVREKIVNAQIPLMLADCYGQRAKLALSAKTASGDAAGEEGLAQQKKGNENKNDNINKKPKLIAFYLPQFHPIPENDEAWGKGFTEWTNVVKAKPRFTGHYQPHIPADLGFYDLRLAETREAQAELAGQYGIHGFCYYHYWFGGNMPLGRPLREVLESGKPDFPFCLCWANDRWSRTWDGGTNDVIIDQKYSEQDDLEHIRWLCGVFRDKRYITVKGKPLMLIYRPTDMPDPAGTVALWRKEARRLGLPGLYLCRVEAFGSDPFPPELLGFDASVEFQPDWTGLYPVSHRLEDGSWISSYREAVDHMCRKEIPPFKRFPCVTPSWDNSSRKSECVMFLGATPPLYRKWLGNVISSMGRRDLDDDIVFINAWNEWAEGDHLEPDQKFGRAWLEATRDALEGTPGQPSAGDKYTEDEKAAYLALGEAAAKSGDAEAARRYMDKALKARGRAGKSETGVCENPSENQRPT